MSLADEILSSDDRDVEKTTAWGRTIVIMPMSGTDRDSYDAEMHKAAKDGNELDNWRSRFLVRCLFDEAGNRVFSNEQAVELGKKSARTIGRLFKLAQKVNGTGEDAVADEAKNS